MTGEVKEGNVAGLGLLDENRAKCFQNRLAACILIQKHCDVVAFETVKREYVAHGHRIIDGTVKIVPTAALGILRGCLTRFRGRWSVLVYPDDNRTPGRSIRGLHR